jgi:hypothetical protein
MNADRATVAATAILQIFETAAEQRRTCIEAYLRDEFVAVARNAINDLTNEEGESNGNWKTQD